MSDVFISTEGIPGQQYVIRFSPGGERVIVNAGNAISAHAKGVGIGEMLSIDMTGGMDTFPAEENDLDHPDVVYPAPKPPEEVAEEVVEQLETQKAGYQADDNGHPPLDEAHDWSDWFRRHKIGAKDVPPLPPLPLGDEEE